MDNVIQFQTRKEKTREEIYAEMARRSAGQRGLKTAGFIVNSVVISVINSVIISVVNCR